jgi:hypothetical protein
MMQRAWNERLLEFKYCLLEPQHLIAPPFVLETHLPSIPIKFEPNYALDS